MKSKLKIVYAYEQTKIEITDIDKNMKTNNNNINNK